MEKRIDFDNTHLQTKHFYLIARILAMVPKEHRDRVLALSMPKLKLTNERFNPRVFEDEVKRFSHEYDQTIPRSYP